MNQHEKLQELYDLLDEKILHLRKARIIETDPLVLFKLDKQIEAEEEERRKIVQEIDNLESVASSEELYRALLKLGYREQVRSFLRFLKAQSIAAFLIHGLLDHGQRWLLNRLVTQHIRFSTMGKMVRIELDRIGRRRDISALWRELGGRVGLGRQHSSTEIAERVFQWWKTQNVILVFHDVDCMPQGYLQELLHEFWLPLASQAREVVSQTKYQLLMFLVDYEGCVGCQDTMFVEQLEPTWEPKIPIKLPTITPFCDRTLTDWIETVETEFNTLPLVEVIYQIEDLVKEILENSDNGVPELAFSEICDLCGCNWYEERERWLKI
ncbi:hypothetical protein SAMD00079811_67570 [Scytonema sp. HK-05]|uniref:hypothetical protein n=1 Tax=Scytonema sp. HK-05 TaxID=1137095 RepID=UPI000936B225|nr:hypothetical protein [Scytonema sp. HK-05]OKH54175.1 hypothetical protein NIES2130_29310 [Scytonema sp. HK-05]BAY49128.1 hypothetical protein SAMD00079811_67570 [Scytonema sp. HK-05]